MNSSLFLGLTGLTVWLAMPGILRAADSLVVPASIAPVHARLAARPGASPAVLVPEDAAGPAVELTSVPAIDPQGQADGASAQWLATFPANPHAKARRYRLEFGDAARARVPEARSRFRFDAVDADSLGLWENDRPVLVYRHGVIRKEGVPADRARSTYVHPLYGLDGEVLTDDFPVDHYHHRGLFWAWPHVGIDGKEYDLWMIKGIAQRFEKWLGRAAGPAGAVLGVENGWYVGERHVMRERIWLTVFPTQGDLRAIDLDCTWIPVDRPVSLAGAEGKSYGGLTLRYAPGTNTVITTPLGNGTNDLYMTKLPWADLARRWDGGNTTSGAAVFIAPDHPDYPPTWLTRHYGVLCLGWPGTEAKTFPAGQPIHCRYRVLVHRGQVAQQVIAEAYEAMTRAAKIAW